MLCEMCSSGNVAYISEVEGSRLSVCEKCSKFGRVISKVSAPRKESKKPLAQEPAATEKVQLIRPDYPAQIKKARERLGLKQEELAKRLLERESVMHKLESGHMKPDLELARKLERMLKISIVEDVELETGKTGEKKKGGGLTIGDILGMK